MRDVAVTEGDKVEAELRFGVSVNTYGVNDLVERVDAVTDAEIDELLDQYADSYEVAAELLPGGDRHDSLRYGARHRGGPALLPHRRRRSVRSPPTSRTSADCVSSRDWRCNA